jgi:hypothetical protein
VLCALVVAAPAHAASHPAFGAPRLTEAGAIQRVLAVPKVRDWLSRYPPAPRTDATFDGVRREWTVQVW